MEESLRKSGIGVVGDVPQGTHFCQFYQTKQDLEDTLVSYFKKGLENNEFCIWVTSQLLDAEEAKKALEKVVSDLDTSLEKGQILIIPCTEWYSGERIFDLESVLSSWVKKSQQALNNYNGVRLGGDIFCQESRNCFFKYKERINRVINNYCTIALFTYSLDRCSITEIFDLVFNHHFALIKRDEKWERIESSGHKKANETVLPGSKAWEQTFDVVPDLITIIDDEYRIVRANLAMAVKLGTTPDKCVGATCYRVVHGTDRPPSFCPHKQLLEDRLEHTVEVQESILGGTFSVSVSPLYDSARKLIGCIHVARDITVRKQIEEALREGEAKYRNIIETANEGILIIDSDFRAAYINKKVEKMLGFSQKEMLGKSGMEFADEEGRTVSKLKWENIRQGISESFELRIIRKDGSSVWALINTKSIFDKKGRFTGALVMLTDITRHKNEEYRISRYNYILQGINRIFSNVVQAKTEEELGNTCLSVALEVTGSQFGFINEMGADGLLHDIAKSQPGWEKCLVDKTGGHLSKNFAVRGLYSSVITNGKCFFTNDPPSRPDGVGLPSGHPPIKSFLGVPLIQEGKTAGLIAVANREGGYTSEQQEDLEAIAPAIVQALQRKKAEQEKVRIEKALHQSEQRVRLKLESILSPDRKIENLELADIVDIESIQSLMADFYELVPIPIGLTDIKGNNLISVGWQEICTRFHRVHPEACKKCVESNLNLSSDVIPGEFKLSKCKNNLWDIATPLFLGGQQVGTIFLGQFFFEDEPLDYKVFRSQAKEYGFKEEEYLAALDSVPRLSRKKVTRGINFLMKFANMLSKLSFSNIKLAQSLAERDHLMDALKESEERFRSVLENSLDSAYRFDLQNNCFDYISSVIEKITGFSIQDINAMTSNDLLARIHPDDHSAVVAGIAKSLNDGYGVHEYRFKCKDGKYRWLADHFSVINDQNGIARFRAGIVRDITEQKEVEEALRFSNNYNRSLIEASLDPLVTIGLDGKIKDVNKSTEIVTGYSRAELIGTDFSDYFIKPQKAKEGYQQVFKEGLVRDYPLEIQHKNGHITPVLYNASVYKDETGKVIGVFAAARDITERKKAEEKIQMLASAVESSEDAIITRSPDGIITSWNKGAEEIYGYSAEEVLGKDMSILEPGDLKGEIKHFAEKIRQGDNFQHYETLRLKKNGKLINISATLSPVFGSSGELVAVSTIARDITERRRAEEVLRLSNLYNRSLIEASLDPLVTIENTGKITDVNRATELVTGYSRQELIGTDFSNYFTEPDKARKGYQQVFINGEVRDYPLEIQHKDGHITPVLYNASVYRDETGKVIGIFAAARDITELKKAEKALRESELKYRQIVETAQEGIWLIDHNDRTIFVNRKISEMLGYSTEELLGQSPQKFMAPEFRIQAADRLHEHMEGTSYLADYHFIHKDGSDLWCILSSSPLFNDQRTYQGSLAMIMDITERKKAEEAVKKAYDNLEYLVKERTAELKKAYDSLKESEQGFAEAQKMAHIGNWEWNIETNETHWSEELYYIYGWDPQDLIPGYDELFKRIHPDDREYVNKTFEEGLKGKQSSIDFRILLANGEERAIHVQTQTIFDKNNIPVRVKGTTQDITERKKAEEKIQLLVNAVESSNDAIVTLSLEGIVTSWNKGAEQIYGYSAEEVLGKNISILEPNSLKGEIQHFSEKIKQGQQIQHYETLRLNKQGKLINISAALSPVFNPSGKLVAILAIARDITERIKAENALAEIDKVRIKEIHHRIKNNLQVISSLLDLQAEKFQDKDVLEAFRESQNRVISMALIHEELYKGEGTYTLNFSAYLKKLAENLFQTYSLKSKNIHLSMDLEDACFDMDIAVPLGIIVSELVSNALKHAFSGKEKGEIRIRLCKEARDNETNKSTFSLKISDNGKGIPENLKLEGFKFLGLKLVNILTDQLDGKLELNKTEGTQFRITFNVVENL